jgi:hypothetical protein
MPIILFSSSGATKCILVFAFSILILFSLLTLTPYTPCFAQMPSNQWRNLGEADRGHAPSKISENPLVFYENF